MSLAGPSSSHSNSLAGSRNSSNDDIIDVGSFFASADTKTQSSASAGVKSAPSSNNNGSNWEPKELRPVPAFYPLERSSRLVEDDLSAVAARLSEANRVLSVHAVYDNDTATASLLTAENVEMHLSLWKTNSSTMPQEDPQQQQEQEQVPNGIVVELQRRKGDSIPFHRYSRYILDAAVGDFDPEEHVETHGPDMDMVYSKRVEHILSHEASSRSAGGDSATTSTEEENAIIAIEIAHSLLMKDRMDARQLGLESLCLLTDPKKTGDLTALIASRVVLLGTSREEESDGAADDAALLFDEAPFQEIREAILSLIQLRRIGEADESSFDDNNVGSEEEEQHITILHNLALAVLANALDVIETEEERSSVPEDTKPRARAGTATSICDSLLNEATEVTGKEILKTLISELGKAEHKPHNAHLSAKCIGSLCRASEEARKRAKELGAKMVVQTALEVGTRTHLKLETECEKLTTSLASTSITAPTDNDEEKEEER